MFLQQAKPGVPEEPVGKSVRPVLPRPVGAGAPKYLPRRPTSSPFLGLQIVDEDFFALPGQEDLSAAAALPKASFAFSRKHNKRIPAALKEVSSSSRPLSLSSARDARVPSLSYNRASWPLAGVGQHRQLLHERLFAEVQGQKEAGQALVVRHQRQGSVHLRRHGGRRHERRVPGWNDAHGSLSSGRRKDRAGSKSIWGHLDSAAWRQSSLCC